MDLAMRLASMDAHGIDMQVFSAPGTEFVEVDEAVALSRDANDLLAEAINAHPNRFAGFAGLPMSSPDIAAEELDRAVNQLGFKGAMIFGRNNDLFLDNPIFNPVLEKAATLNVPLYLHPTIPSKAIQNAYYGGFDLNVNARFATAGWGWHMETGIHLLRMILGGVFDRCPNLQIILGHWGEMIPFYLERINYVMTPVATNLQRPVAEYFLNNVHITPSGMFSVPSLLHAIQMVGVDRIMYSVDYPWVGNEGARDFLENAPITQADKEKIAHRNVEKLLNL
jgi:predicted TIM-barrel fold metal-dependent hydrolase